MSDSKYIHVYESLCPDDHIADNDPRRDDIIAEMRAIERAGTYAEAVEVIEWWDAWPNSNHLTPLEFVRDALILFEIGEDTSKF